MSRERAIAAVEGMNDDESIDSITLAAATAVGPVKLQAVYVDENGGDMSPSLMSVGFRIPLGSAELRGHMTRSDPDMKSRDDNEAWGLLVMNDFGGGYFGMIGIGNYEDGGKGMAGSPMVTGGQYVVHAAGDTAIEGVEVGDSRLAVQTEIDNTSRDKTVMNYKAATDGVHKDAGDMDNIYVSLTKSMGGGLSLIAEYSTVTKTVTDAMDYMDDDDETTNTFVLSLLQSF